MSIALIAKGDVTADDRAARACLAFLQRQFEFYELVTLVNVTDFDKHRAAYESLVSLRNVRCLVLRDGTGDYRKAIVAATQTIGDFVFIIHADEHPLLDLSDMCQTAMEHGCSVALRLNRRIGLTGRFMGKLLSATSGYDVDPTLLRSAVHSRTHIGQIAARTDREVALRFMPRGGQRPSDLIILEVDRDKGRPPRTSLWRQIGHGLDVVANSPPVLYRYLAILSFFVSFVAVCYAIYALILLVVGTDLQPGWLTTSLAISGSTTFLGLALGGIFSALYQILVLLRKDFGSEIIRDVSNTDLFREFHRLNVETPGES